MSENSVEVMKCSRCGNPPKVKTTDKATWYGRYHNAELKEVICVDCWRKGERWTKPKTS